jgi:hypothetical protein
MWNLGDQKESGQRMVGGVEAKSTAERPENVDYCPRQQLSRRMPGRDHCREAPFINH